MNEDIVKLRKDGLANAQIAKKLGKSPAYVANVIAEAVKKGEKIKPMINPWTDEELNILRQGYRGKQAKRLLVLKGYHRSLPAIYAKRKGLGLVG